MSQIFAGPYSLLKKSATSASLITLCIMENNHISERFYKNGNLINQVSSQHNGLAFAIEAAAKRLEYLMQYEKYCPQDPISVTSLQ